MGKAPKAPQPKKVAEKATGKRKNRAKDQEPELEEEEEQVTTSDYGSDSDSEPYLSDEGEESSDDEDGEAFDQIQVDLGLYDASETDFHGIKALLSNFLDGAEFSSSDLADAVIASRSVQSVIKTGETPDDGLIGMISVLNMKRYAKEKFMKELESFLKKHCPDDAHRAKLDKVIGTGSQAAKTALVLTERFLNCPEPIVPPLLQYMEQELKYAEKDPELKKEEREAFQLSHFLFVSRAFVDPEEQPEEQPKDKKRAKKSNAPSTSTSPLVYTRVEDEFLHQVADWAFTFHVENRLTAKHDLRMVRLVMLVSREAYSKARLTMEEAIKSGK